MFIKNWFYLKKDAPGLKKENIENPSETYVNIVDVDSPNSGNIMSVSDFAVNIHNMNFKKGSIGEKVSFRKESGTDPSSHKDVIIPGKLEITRSNGGGIYNIALESNYDSNNDSPQYTFWNTQYVDAANTSWASLWDVQNRTYDTWRNAADGPNSSPAPPQYVGMPAVMKYDDGNTKRYWLIMFTEWGIGNYDEYGFAYDRWEILPAVEFIQPSTNNTNTPNVIDVVSDGVHITRRYTGGGLYNTVTESYFLEGVSPANTKWNSSFIDSRIGYSGYTDLSNLESRVYSSFYNALDGAIGNNIPGTELIMHDMTTDLYYKVDFTDWAQGCGGNGQPGGVTGYNILDPGAGYPDGYYNLNGVDGSGSNISLQVTVTGGIITSVDSINSGGENYQVGDVITFPYIQTSLFTIEVTDVCSMGGFAYTRTVIPQSCGIKFADGTVMNTAVTASAGTTGTDMVYTQGLLSPQVQSDFIQLPDTITDSGSTLFKTYKLGGIADFNNPGASSYAYLIGVIVGDDKLKLINDATVIGADGVTTYDGISGKFAVNALVKNASTGAVLPLTFATIVLDNTIASPNDYFVSIVAVAGASWTGTAYIDIEFMAKNPLSYYN